MATHTAEVSWLRGDAVFVDARYSRRHSIRFDGGADVAGSSSPHIVPPPYSDASAVDPEEMLAVTLRPDVAFSGAPLPEPSEVARMHHAAHTECFIAQSVRCDVRCEPV